MKKQRTAWISILTVFLATFLSSFLNSFFILSGSIIASLFVAVLSVCFYGFIVWLFFIPLLLILDFIIFFKSIKHFREKLALEFFLVFSLLSYWNHIYHYWLFGVAIISFLFSLIFRGILMNRFRQE